MEKRFSFIKKALSSFLATYISVSSIPFVQSSAAENTFIDLNGDGIFSIADLVVFQKWLLGAETDISDWEMLDFSGDGQIDIFDFCAVRKEAAKLAAPIEETGRIYSKIELTDTYAGVTAYRGIIPEGWTVQMQSNWSNIGAFPGQENVIFVSPDGNAAVQIASPQEYKYSSLRNNGVVLSEFTTYLTYMNAPTYIDAFVNSNYTDAEFVKDIEVPSEQQETVAEYAFSKAQTMAMYVQQYKLNFNVVGYEGTVARRQYKSSQGMAEYSCAVPAYEYISSTGILNDDTIVWRTLNTIAYYAADEEAFDKYYNDYEMIVANGYFTAEFYSAVDYVCSMIVEAIARGLTTSGTDAAGSYSSSGTEISSSDRETQERVFQAWDDYIREEDVYTGTDGSNIRVSMYNETVAQDGNNFYIGSVTNIPDGYTMLVKQ